MIAFHTTTMRERRPLWLLSTSVGLTVLMAALIALTQLNNGSPPTATPYLDMTLVSAGSFTMGSLKGHPDEQPPHSVYVEAFYIDTYEVTNQQYLRFFKSARGQDKDRVWLDPKAEDPDSHIVYRNGRYVVESGYEGHPVTLVSWYGAQAYCEHQGKRLPTEAEWEKAARGSDGRVYPWGDFIDENRLNAGGRLGETTPVGSYPPGASPYGVHDLAGNVWEWTADWYQPYPASPHRSAFYGDKYKVVRGGSWNHPDGDARTTERDLAHPARRIHVVGFRCAASP